MLRIANRHLVHEVTSPQAFEGLYVLSCGQRYIFMSVPGVLQVVACAGPIALWPPLITTFREFAVLNQYCQLFPSLHHQNRIAQESHLYRVIYCTA